jgi:FKBP-type peptidyl-prolyl cis-trans isomerase FkpA
MKILLQLSFASLILALAQGYCAAQDAPPAAITDPTAPVTVATAPAKITSLIKIDNVIGTGAEATRGLYVDVHYTGWIYDPKAPDRHGVQFDSSRGGKPLTFQVDARNVIRGWDMGVQGMKVGGKRTLIIPGYLAYGTKGNASIPPNATLIFDVELMDAK